MDASTISRDCRLARVGRWEWGIGISTLFFFKRHGTPGLVSRQALRSPAWSRGIFGPFIGPRRYVSEGFAVVGGRRPRGMVGSGR